MDGEDDVRGREMEGEGKEMEIKEEGDVGEGGWRGSNLLNGW